MQTSQKIITRIIASRYCEAGYGVDSLERYIHSMWYMYYQLSQNISNETPDHESLVLNIIQIQGMGPLTRPVRGNYSVDIARTAEGTLWNDLPFLATDMTNFWNRDFVAGRSRMMKIQSEAYVSLKFLTCCWLP